MTDGMKTWSALLISCTVLASACCLLVCFQRPAPGPARMVGLETAPALQRIEERLERIEAAIDRLAWRTGEVSLEPPPAAPSPTPQESASLASEGLEGTAALRSIERRLDELSKQLSSRHYLDGTATVAWEPPEEAPPELQVRLESRLVQDGDKLAVTVYWVIVSGASSATEQDWVGLFALDATDHQYTSYQYTKGLPAGEATLQLPGTAGLYEARYFFKSGYARVPGASGPVQVPHVEPPPADDGGRTKE